MIRSTRWIRWESRSWRLATRRNVGNSLRISSIIRAESATQHEPRAERPAVDQVAGRKLTLALELGGQELDGRIGRTDPDPPGVDPDQPWRESEGRCREPD